jgi:hypothetical protein
LFLVDQIVKADGLCRELTTHLPGQVAIWTTAHDADHIERQEGFEPAARFRKDDLLNFPVAIVTHALFQGSTSDKARVVLHRGQEVHRALTLVDEQMQDVNVFSVQLSVAEGLREKMQAIGEDTTHMDALLKFMIEKAFAEGSLEKPQAQGMAGSWPTTSRSSGSPAMMLGAMLPQTASDGPPLMKYSGSLDAW